MAATRRTQLRLLSHTAAAIVGLVLATQSLAASTLTVTNTADSGPGSLRQTLADAASGDMIVFDASLDGDTIRLGGGGTLFIDKALTIDASALPNRITVSGDRNSDGLPDAGDVTTLSITLPSATDIAAFAALRITGTDLNPDRAGGIHCTAGSLHLQDCELFSCHGTTGGGIRIAGGDLSMTDCQVIQCVSQSHGGGVYCTDGNVTVEGCDFLKNDTPLGPYFPYQSGGGIYTAASSAFIFDVQIVDSRFTENRAGAGGGIYVWGGAVSCRDSTFLSNRSWHFGGAAGLIDCSGSVAESRFESNKSLNGGQRQGGALYVTSNSGFSVLESVFEANEAGPTTFSAYIGGGAVHSRCTPSPLLIENCQISRNIAPYGGGVTNDGALVIRTSVFDGNRAEFDGGALLNGASPTSDTAAFTVVDSTFVRNTAQNGGGIASFATPQRRPLIANSTFIFNQASTHGGGIYNFGGLLYLTNCTLAHNSAPTAAAFMGTGVSITLFSQCTVSTNAAGGGAGIGGLQYEGTLLNGWSLANSIIANNTPVANPQVFNVWTSSNPGTFPTSITSGDPLLAPLGDYGGPTLTMPPLPGSPALNAGDSSSVAPDTADLDNDGDTTEPVPFDQRGFPRIAGSAVDIGAVEYDASRDLPLIFSADGDGDGVPFGVEHALGMNGHTSDLTSPRRFRLGMDSISSQPKLTFGFNTAALPFTTWSVKRSTTLTPEGWTEIYRYHGPTMTETTTGTTVTPMGDLLEVTDTNPPADGAFYRFEAIPEP